MKREACTCTCMVRCMCRICVNCRCSRNISLIPRPHSSEMRATLHNIMSRVPIIAAHSFAAQCLFMHTVG